MNPQEVTDELKLTSLKDKIWFVVPSCATTGEGLLEGLVRIYLFPFSSFGRDWWILSLQQAWLSNNVKSPPNTVAKSWCLPLPPTFSLRLPTKSEGGTFQKLHDHIFTAPSQSSNTASYTPFQWNAKFVHNSPTTSPSHTNTISSPATPIRFDS